MKTLIKTYIIKKLKMKTLKYIHCMELIAQGVPSVQYQIFQNLENNKNVLNRTQSNMLRLAGPRRSNIEIENTVNRQA